MPPSPTPASSARPMCPTSSVSTTVITLYDTVETAMGQANRMSSLRGLSFQARFMAQPAKFGEASDGRRAKKNRGVPFGPAAGDLPSDERLVREASSEPAAAPADAVHERHDRAMSDRLDGVGGLHEGILGGRTR